MTPEMLTGIATAAILSAFGIITWIIKALFNESNRLSQSFIDYLKDLQEQQSSAIKSILSNAEDERRSWITVINDHTAAHREEINVIKEIAEYIKKRNGHGT